MVVLVAIVMVVVMVVVMNAYGLAVFLRFGGGRGGLAGRGKQEGRVEMKDTR